ncbi:MAG: hypothetical protein IJY20_05550 [Clostridia bacterium]|nr:hypothetical protein [Clostridia bacterium]
MNFENTIQSLKYMLFGMVGIFIITAIIIACIFALNYFSNKEKKPEIEE